MLEILFKDMRVVYKRGERKPTPIYLEACLIGIDTVDVLSIKQNIQKLTNYKYPLDDDIIDMEGTDKKGIIIHGITPSNLVKLADIYCNGIYTAYSGNPGYRYTAAGSTKQWFYQLTLGVYINQKIYNGYINLTTRNVHGIAVSNVLGPTEYGEGVFLGMTNNVPKEVIKQLNIMVKTTEKLLDKKIKYK